MAGQKKVTVKVELKSASDLAAYNAWSAAKTAKDAAEEAMATASEILKLTFRDAGATVGTIGGTPVMRLVDSSRKTFDGEILYKLAPKAAAKALRTSEFDYLRKA